MREMFKKTIGAVALVSLAIFAGCSEDSTDEKVSVPDGKFTIAQSHNNVTYEVSSKPLIAGTKPITLYSNTIDTTIMIDTPSTIIETRSDSTILFQKDTATIRFAVKKDSPLIETNPDTAVVNATITSLLALSELSTGVADVKVTNYSITNAPLTFENNQIVSTITITATIELKYNNIPAVVTVNGTTKQFGNLYTGSVPPSDWPQTVVTGNIADLPIPGLSALSL